jgi:toxin-antitoxin system PIN domain toxin
VRESQALWSEPTAARRPVKLVDVGLWLAAVWGRHVHHPVAVDWLGRETDDIAFCRVTQMGLLRLLSSPAIMGDDAIDCGQAWRIYDQLYADERVLWADEPAQLDPVWRAISARDDKSHKLWTDDYLAAFAQASNATLTTLDRTMPARYPSVEVEPLLP